MKLVRCVSYSWLLVVAFGAINGTTEQNSGTDIGVSEQFIPKAQVNPSIEGHTELVPNAENSESKLEIMKLTVNDDDVSELLQLHDDIDKEALNDRAAALPKLMEPARLGRALVSSAPENGGALSDEDINKLVQMISFPLNENNTQSAGIIIDEELQAKVEPRNNRKRGSRDLKPRGYYILAFSPINGPLVPTYTKLDIIPAERALDGDLAVRKVNKHRIDSDLMMSGSEVDEARLISMKKFNRYVRRLMKQIRKGTRKIQRKTRFKSKQAEPTVENFLRKLYAQRGVQKKKTSWFSW